MTLISNLLVLYAGIMAINVVLSAVLWIGTRGVIQQKLFFVWAAAMTSSVVQGFAADGDLTIVLGFSTTFLVDLSLANLLAGIVSLEVRQRRYIIGLAVGVLSAAALANRERFWLTALPVCLAVAAPLFFTATRALSRWRQLTPTGRTLIVSCLLFCMHNLDFAFLRDKDEYTVIGFTIALFVVFALSISGPAAALEHASAERARIEGLHRIQSKFFANVSHELRTPLTLIMAPVERLLGEPKPRADKEQLETVRRNALRLLRHIDELLDLSRLDAGGLRLDVAPIDLSALASSICEAAQPLAQNKSLHLTLDAPNSPRDVFGDAHRIDSIITNLVGNALKYTPQGGRIALRVREAPDEARVEVSDDGPGVPVTDQERVFERFFQLDQRDRRRTGGVGIGLALAKELAELHGGTLTMTSKPGQGSTFTLTLRKGRAHLGPEVLEKRRSFRPERVVGRRFDDARIIESPTVATPPHKHSEEDAATYPEASRSRVLVVEDLDEMRAFLRNLLEEEFDVIEAVDGGDGLRLIRSESPDIVVTDVMMPVSSGIDLCRAIKSDATLRNIPVVLVTAQVGSEATLGGYAHGADDFVTKPFHPQVLMARIKAQLRLRELGIQLAQREKILGIGMMAAGVAHEIRNPLNAVMNASRALSEGRVAPDAAREMLRVIEEGTLRIDAIVGALDEHAHPAEKGESGPYDVREGVEATLMLLQHRLRQVRVVRDFRSTRQVTAPAGPINQVIVNLIDNSLRAAAKTISIQIVDDTEHVRVRVTDDGTGVQKEIANRIFDPFFTTREVGEGSGLGLYLSRQIARRHRGDLRLVTSDQPGACFDLRLPAYTS